MDYYKIGSFKTSRRFILIIYLIYSLCSFSSALNTTETPEITEVIENTTTSAINTTLTEASNVIITEITVPFHSNDCEPSEKTEISRDPYNCTNFYLRCISTQDQSMNNSINILKKTESRACDERFLFDQVELKCLPSNFVDCNKFSCPDSKLLIQDKKRPTFFIECDNDTGINLRHECEPFGTEFSEETQMCIKPIVIDTFSIYVIRILLRFLVSTKHSLSPWMEVIKLNESSEFNSDVNENLIENKRFPMNEEDDEIEIFTQDRNLIAAYYSVIVGIALLFVLSFLATSIVLAKICWKGDVDKDEDLTNEFYRYNQNDSYIMTRL